MNTARQARTWVRERFEDEAFVTTLFRLAHRFVGEIHASDYELVMQRELYFAMVEAVFRGDSRTLFCSDEPWPSRAVFPKGAIIEMWPIRTEQDKTRYLALQFRRLVTHYEAKGKNREAYHVERFTETLERLLPHRNKAEASRMLCGND